MAITTFERVEQKYIIDEAQKAGLISILLEHMEFDPFCLNEKTYRIRNIYLDSDDENLIRTSLLKPKYKEKLRLRKYDGQQNMFIEIKKKYNGTVSKRRTEISEEEFKLWIEEKVKPKREKYLAKQIVDEIDYLLNRYDVHENVYVAYDRLGFFDKDNPELRVTFDSNLRYRRDDLSWDDTNTESIIPKDKFILEIKDSINLPLWLIDALNKLQIVKSSFSKYGTEYTLKIKEKKENA